MKSSYSNAYGFLPSALSVFDIGASMQNNKFSRLSRGLSCDMQQLSSDQQILAADYKKASDRMIQEISGDHFE